MTTRYVHGMSALLAAALGAMPACDTDDGGDGMDSPRESLAPFDGREVFTGIFFVDGPVAKLLPELVTDIRQQGIESDDDAELERLRAQFPRPTEVDGEVRAEIDEFEARVLAAIDAADPTFFARFAEDMQSGDHFRVDAGLAEGAQALEAAVAAEYGMSLTELRQDPSKFRCWDFVVPGYILDIVWVVPPTYVYYWY